jgi:hypothetical protein
MDLELLIIDTLKDNKFVDIDEVKLSIRNLYPFINLDELDKFHIYLRDNHNDINIKEHNWSQYYKIESHYRNGLGSLDAIDYVSTFDLYCQINCLYKSGNYYY